MGSLLVNWESIVRGSSTDLDSLDLPKIKDRSIDEFKLEIFNSKCHCFGIVKCNLEIANDIK